MEKIAFNSDIFKSNNSIYFFPKDDELGLTLYEEKLEEVSIFEIINKIGKYNFVFFQEPAVIMLPINIQFELMDRAIANKFPDTEYDVLMNGIPKRIKVLFYVQDDIKSIVSIPK